MKPEITGELMPLFKYDFCFTYLTQTFFYSVNDGFYIMNYDSPAVTRKYLKSKIEGYMITFYFDHNILEFYNLRFLPLYYFKEQLPTN